MEWRGDSRPRVVSHLDDARAVAAGERHSLALTHDGRVFAWGANDRGQLGIPGGDTESPIEVGGLDPAIAIAAGADTSFAVLADGAVRAWGANDDGQLGVGDFLGRETPTPVAGLPRVVRVVSSDGRTGALDDDGDLWLFGRGQASPARAETPGEIVGLHLSGETTVAERSDGRVWITSPYGQALLSDSGRPSDEKPDTGAGAAPPAEPGAAVLVVAAGPLSPLDRAIERRLRQLGFDVSLQRAAQAVPATVAGAGLLVISSSVEARDVDPRIAESRTPIVTWEPFLFGSLGLTAPGRLPSRGATSGATLSVIRAEHPLSAGIEGEVRVLEGAGKLTWGAPAPDADVVAVGPTGAAVFALEAGSPLGNGGRAPERRVGLFLPAAPSLSLTEQGWALFDAAALWAGGLDGPSRRKAVTSPGTGGGGVSTMALTGGSGTILLVVGNLTLSAGDTAVRNRMTAMGFTVQTRLASQSTASDANGKVLVYVSGSSPNGDVLAKFAYVSVPVVIQSAGIVDDMYMSSFANRGNCAASTQSAVVTSSHAIAYGLTGTQTISTSAGALAWGTPSANGVRVLSCVGNANQAVTFTYEQGASMVGWNAPARRVMWGFYDPIPQTFTTTGGDLFERMIFWATRTNVQPYVNAGPDQSVEVGLGATLSGVVVDDGLPSPPGSTTKSWTKTSGPGTVSFGSPSSPATSAAFSTSGVYVLRLTASDGALSTYDEVTINAYQPVPNQPPVVNAGPDVAVALPNSATLNGSVTDDGLPNPPATTTKSWTKVSGPGTVSFGTPTSVSTTAAFSLPGTYTLRLTASDSVLSASDDVVVAVTPSVLLVVGSATLSTGDARLKSRFETFGFTVVVKVASAAASSDATGRAGVWVSSTAPNADVSDKFTFVSVPVCVQATGIVDDMNMTLTDAGYRGADAAQQVSINAPAHPLSAGLQGSPTTSALTSYGWGIPNANAANVASAPSGTSHAVVFAYETGALMYNSQTAPQRRLYFGFLDPAVLGNAGERLLDAAVQWLTRVNAAPWVDAGPDSATTLTGPTASLTLSGRIVDDALPNPPAATTAAWSLVSGAASVSFGSPSQAVTTATFSKAGGYLLRLGASDGSKTASDVVLVTVRSSTNAAPVVSAGPDRTVRLPQSASLAAVASDDGLPGGALTVTWTVTSGPGIVTFGSPSSPQTTTTFSDPGVYVLRVTVSDGALATWDEVQVSADPTSDVLFVAGQDPLGAEDAAARSRLESLGFSVAVKTDAAVTAADATGKALVVLSASASLPAAGTALASVGTPLVAWQPFLFDELGMAGSGASDTGQTNGTQILMAATTHTLAASLQGTQTVYATSAPLGWGVVGAYAAKVATLTSDATKATVFGYEAGSAMVAGAAPARRVGLFARPASLNDTGWSLFEAAVTWATQRPARALVVTAAAPTASDVALRERLAGLGFAVQTVADAAATSAATAGKDLVVIAPTASAATLGTTLRDASVPVVVAHADAYPGMALTGSVAGTDFGRGTGTQINVTAGHPLAAALGGTVAVLTTSGSIGFGVPAAGGILAAAPLAGPPGGAAVFGYDAAAAMVGASAPERRVGFFLDVGGASSLTTEGWRLFDAAALWAAASDGDRDGLGFADEHRNGTDPANPDTNGDGILDGAAVDSGRSPTTLDTDGDGVPNATELLNGTDPFRADTDADGVGDGVECFPLDPSRSQCTPPTPGDTTPPVVTLREPTNATLVGVVPPLP